MTTEPRDYTFADMLLAVCVQLLNESPPAPGPKAGTVRRHQQPDTPPAYVCRLPGVSYDRSAHRLASRLTWRENGRQYARWIGSGAPTWEEEQRLHEAWMAAKEERDGH